MMRATVNFVDICNYADVDVHGGDGGCSDGGDGGDGVSCGVVLVFACTAGTFVTFTNKTYFY